MDVDGKSLSTFNTLVNIQKANGVKLITGWDNSTRAKELVHLIGEAIREKMSHYLKGSSFAVFSDGSQARKTGSEKELVMVRMVRTGVPLFYCVALQNLDDYGDSNAEIIKEILNILSELSLKF